MSTAIVKASSVWMSPRELADLEREAGRSFTTIEDAHRYRIRRLKNRLISSLLAHRDPLEELLAENERRLESQRQQYTREAIKTDAVWVAFEVFECLRLQSFPPAETARFLRMLDAWGTENPGLLCLAEAVRIAQWRGR
jgi:hypothetical protein